MSSQPILNSHTHCNKILALIVEGMNHPGASNILGMSETRAHIVMLSFLQRCNSQMKLVQVGTPFYPECFRVLLWDGNVVCQLSVSVVWFDVVHKFLMQINGLLIEIGTGETIVTVK